MFTLIAVAFSVLLSPGSAAAAPVRDNSASRPVYFVPGFSSNGKNDCGGYWGPMQSAMRSYGWTGSYHSVGYYGPDTNCNTKIFNGDQNSHLEELGRLLAWNIYSSFSKNNISVDVVAHSMGGLIARAALTGVVRKQSGWPPYLYIEDVVTISTPHQGTGWGTTCAFAYGFQQCKDMVPGSGFLKWLYDSPQSAIGTDWTLVGLEDDAIVGKDSAIGMNSGHKVVYRGGQNLAHEYIQQVSTGSFQMWYWNYYDSQWYWTTSGAPPTQVANNAAYFWWKW